MSTFQRRLTIIHTFNANEKGKRKYSFKSIYISLIIPIVGMIASDFLFVLTPPKLQYR